MKDTGWNSPLTINVEDQVGGVCSDSQVSQACQVSQAGQSCRVWQWSMVNVLCAVVLLCAVFILSSCNTDAAIQKRSEQLSVRSDVKLENGWKFAKGDFPEASEIAFDDSQWEDVVVPHDWAIYGPFDRENDIDNVAITQNFETQKSVKTGRTGGLPYMGVGWYRTKFDVDDFDADKKSVEVLFDGAMSQAKVYVNGKYLMEWPLGYNSFYGNITEYLNPDGKNNTLAVRLENPEHSSRWYPGAGLYRNVHIITTQKTHFPTWGTYITTPKVSQQEATVQIRYEIENGGTQALRIVTEIKDESGKTVASREEWILENMGIPTACAACKSGCYKRNTTIAAQINNPSLWTPETPVLYTANSTLYDKEGQMLDSQVIKFGVRSIEIIPEKGFFLNGKSRKFKGVCNHHDLGPLGAAVNEAAIRRQLTILKDMGCDAIRTSHNMPAPELISLCDEMGFMVMVEAFDEWDIAKCENGYHLYFEEWAEKDMVNMIRHYRNNPSVVMWSIGNEVPTQCSDQGYKVASFLQEICHREDPTRPVTCGMDQVSCVVANGFAKLMDVVGLNYRTFRYIEAYNDLPQKIVLGSESASTVSSRGVYKFPVEKKSGAMYDDHQASSYDLEYCWWSNIPEEDFALADDYPWALGQFVWTGFDYLGEPTPYDTDAWPSHSSLFGIVDLAYIPKDRYYLYRSQWNQNDNTLHILPHWNWEGHEGDTIPVFCYTNYPVAELFVNGVSQGVMRKDKSDPIRRYRLIWDDVVYQPGEIEVVAYNEIMERQQSAKVVTAGKPHHIELSVDRATIAADGKDLAFINAKIVDKDGNLCPNEKKVINFDVTGAGSFRAIANGDPTCVELFHLPEMHTFSGQLTAIVQSCTESGKIHVTAQSDGIKSSSTVIKTRK
ncbi:MAG: glycoside hydrolase family 2 TIM barrel-domain containing protein [Bacteroidales bacterium]|nr:glycoside hydrolase family 2 TIM barrel-domain containing protein [Bacteroidales bacterium]